MNKKSLKKTVLTTCVWAGTMYCGLSLQEYSHNRLVDPSIKEQTSIESALNVDFNYNILEGIGMSFYGISLGMLGIYLGRLDNKKE